MISSIIRAAMRRKPCPSSELIIRGWYDLLNAQLRPACYRFPRIQLSKLPVQILIRCAAYNHVHVNHMPVEVITVLDLATGRRRRCWQIAPQLLPQRRLETLDPAVTQLARFERPSVMAQGHQPQRLRLGKKPDHVG